MRLKYPNIICAHSCYCRQYNSAAFFFSSCLQPFVWSIFYRRSDTLWTILWKSWACNGQVVSVPSPKRAERDSKCVWAAPRCVLAPLGTSWMCKRVVKKKIRQFIVWNNNNVHIYNVGASNITTFFCECFLHHGYDVTKNGERSTNACVTTNHTLN